MTHPYHDLHPCFPAALLRLPAGFTVLSVLAEIATAAPHVHGSLLRVTVKPLLPSELAFMLQQGRADPGKRARRFARDGDAHVSRSWRRSAV